MRLQKTDLARQLLGNPRRDLPAGHRMLLITVDGRRDLRQLRELARNMGLNPSVVEDLYGRGLIAPVEADLLAQQDAHRAAELERAQREALARQQAAVQQARRLARAKLYALDLVARMLVGQDGELRALARHIDSEDGLQLWIEAAAQQIRERSSDERAERFKERVQEELGLALA
ncbi:hypothetical protein H5407_17130 [Mitsuaria sp. WAJ17]|uniref:hypothetical protein n=1 Tax=Mitsuaria sp. WAJ17 TaxID=2761452 RepID=UPI001604864B|nr:hypothetical protein [Mitsuaria sp. WAJ17]MBB2486955.1 hypothetical protein [Mitsuaria sp. WAJ17]